MEYNWVYYGYFDAFVVFIVLCYVPCDDLNSRINTEIFL